MRKHVIQPGPDETPRHAAAWLPLEQLARVEITSDDPAYPIEAALLPGLDVGCWAAQPGEQTIRLRFDRPQRLSRIRLPFLEADTPRTQEFVLRWPGDGGRSYHEIVRQQWNFIPPHTGREIEAYRVELAGVTALELAIVPNASGGAARVTGGAPARLIDPWVATGTGARLGDRPELHAHRDVPLMRTSRCAG